MPGERCGLVADAFHQIAVAGDDVGAVIDEPVAEARVQVPLGDRHADGVGEALAQGTGGGFDAGHGAVFGMAGARAAQLAEALDVVERDAAVAAQIKERVEQHRAVPGREHEAVAVGPIGRRRIEFQKPREQNGRRIRHAHRHAGMAGFGRLDRVHGERPDGVGKKARFGLVPENGRRFRHGGWDGYGHVPGARLAGARRP